MPASGLGWRGGGAMGYLTLLALGVGLFFLIRIMGSGLSSPVAPESTLISAERSQSVNVVFHVMSTLAAVIGLGFVLGRAGRLVGQPPVMGEVVAGILLGPSLLGAVWPDGMHFLIPSAKDDPGGQVLAGLKAVSQLGIVLYMFLVGLELNAASVVRRAGTAVFISHSSIVVSFLLGATLALGLFPSHSPAGVSFTPFALFLGVALAVSAFPILARIIHERGLAKTELGVTAMTCAAVDDGTAWCLVALVVGVARSQTTGAIVVVASLVAFIGFMIFTIRPLLARFSQRLDSNPGPLPPGVVSGIFLAVFISALTTELLGVHAVFGAFLFGTMMPHDGRLAREFSDKLKAPVTVLLLPAFFAYTGMRTEVGRVSGAEDWLWCVVVVIVATLGKFGGTLAAARLTGHSWREAAALGVMMNTRGLMGLIVLEMGLDLDLIGPKLFTILVLMALVTTLATSPLLSWLVQYSADASSSEEASGIRQV